MFAAPGRRAGHQADGELDVSTTAYHILFTCQLNVTRDSVRIYSLVHEYQPPKWKFA